MSAHISRLAVAAALVGGVLHSSAFADIVTVDKAMLEPGSNAGELFAAPALSGEMLDQNRGGSGVEVLNKTTLDGVVSDNQASNLATGSNWITSGSFANASGQSTVIQNSGNNVLIQNATIINLQVQ